MAPNTPAPPAIDPKTIRKATKALLKWHKSKPQNQNNPFIYLILTLKKPPQRPPLNPFKIALPHALHDPKTAQLCLITHDRTNKPEITAKIARDKIPVSKVLKLSTLKKDYKPFNDKLNLCDSFDTFFADSRIAAQLPKVLGRCFSKRRKMPVSVDLRRDDWGREIESFCRSGILYLRRGTCCVVRVARVSMGVEGIVENVVEGIKGVAGVVPSKWGNVRSFHLKLLESLALPVYKDGRIQETGNEGEMERDHDPDLVLDEDGFGSEDSDSDSESEDLGKLLDKMRKTGDNKERRCAA